MKKYALEGSFSQLSNDILVCEKISILGKDIVEIIEGYH
jgi:hypothetical protein